MIRVNSVLPTQVSTTMVMNEQTYDESRYITGVSLPVDAGSLLK